MPLRFSDLLEPRLRDDVAERFGEAFLVPSDDEEGLAEARVLENLVPSGVR